MTRSRLIGLTAGLCSLLASALVGAVVLSDPIPEPIGKGVRVALTEVSSGLTSPVWGVAAPGDVSHLHVVDQVGLLWRVDLASGDKTVVLDVSARLVTLTSAFDERGFLGVAFHPGYASNGLLYTYTSQPSEATADFPLPDGVQPDHDSVITQWQVPEPAASQPMVDPGSARELLRIEQPQSNHNGGALSFGPDGLLHIALGDGGSADDQGAGHSPGGNGQDTGNPLGSILRIDPLGDNAHNGQYGIPADNPFFPGGGGPHGGTAGCADGICDEILAYGFRNPYRISFDAASGTLLAGDVGQNDIEEVDLVTAGGNYGWPIKEGSFCFDDKGNGPGVVTSSRTCGNGLGLIDPIAQYDHDEGAAIIGGFVYRGSGIPNLAGRYVFGDYFGGFSNGLGRVFHLKRANLSDSAESRPSGIAELRLAGQPLGLGAFLFGLGQDGEGEIYLLVTDTSPGGGRVLKLEAAQ